MPWNKLNALSAECPECSTEKVFLQEPKVGQLVYCALCGTKLEVAYLRPIMLDYVDDFSESYVDGYENEEIDYDDEVF